MRGVTSLDNHLYVLHGNKSEEQIEVYDVDSFSFLRYITVPGLVQAVDIVACEHYCCAYVSNASQQSVHKVTTKGKSTQWPVNDGPTCLSVTAIYSVLVTFRKVHKIKEFTTDGLLLCEVVLQENVPSPWHTVQLSSGELVVCHGSMANPDCVCLTDADGSVVKSYGGPKGISTQYMNTPSHMAVDSNKFVFVVDRNNYRVLLLSATLAYVHEVVSREQLEWKPYRISLDVKRRRLYVAVNEHIKAGDYTAGRVIVVSV